MVCHDKDEIEQKLMECNKKRFRKVKELKVRNDKIHQNFNNGNARDKALSESSNRKYFDEDNV